MDDQAGSHGPIYGQHANQMFSRVSLVDMKHSNRKSQVEQPEESLAQNTPERHVDRKAMQLCSQIRYSLEYAMNTALKGEYGLTVLEVVPAPNTSHLLVFVQSFDELSFDQSVNLEAELKRLKTTLRTAVSESIHRRKTPGLSFQIVPRVPLY